MAKIGYIMATAHYDKLEEDRQWMQHYGCVKIVEENDADEKSRPLWKQLMISGQWMYNIGYAPEANNEHYYTAGATYAKGAHRVMLSYTKTRAGYNCSGGVCRYVPKQEGVNITYNFTW